MEAEELYRITDRIAKNIATDEEIGLYNLWCLTLQERGEPIADFHETQAEMIHQINDGIDHFEKRKPKLFYQFAVAASITIFLGLGAYFMLHSTEKAREQIVENQAADIAPGGNKAILILSDGKKISLTKAGNGRLARQTGSEVSKTAAGQIRYISMRHDDSAIYKTSPLEYNTLETPAGGQFQIQLHDGTKVWLNAASSLTYPVAFTGKERLVTLTGEAYFEVAHDVSKPFQVISNGQTISVLGTRFNVNTYGDDGSMKTTLVDGKIKILTHKRTMLMKPGQQAIVSPANEIMITNAIDLEEITAWKNGFFKFNHADIKTMMKQFARWYDVDVKYEGDISNEGISGKIYRNVNASQALEILQYLDIHYRIEEVNNKRKIVITSN